MEGSNSSSHSKPWSRSAPLQSTTGRDHSQQYINEAVTNPAYATWKNCDLLLRSCVIGTLSEEALYFVVGCNSARNVWSAIEENLLQVTKDREVQLKQQLQDMRLGS